MRVGFVTIGQSPRVDVMKDLAPMLDREKIEYIEAGALDNLTRDEIGELRPESDTDYVLVSRLRDGTQVVMSRSKIMPLVQAAIDSIEVSVDVIGLFCTGELPELRSHKPLIEPSLLLRKNLEALSPEGSVTIIVPSSDQVEDVRAKLGKNRKVEVIAVSPYTGTVDSFLTALKNVHSCDLVVMDCIGYSVEMKNLVKQTLKKPVILPRTLLARIISELA